MSQCIRNGVPYRRHKWEMGECLKCGIPAPKVEGLDGSKFISEVVPDSQPIHEGVPVWEGEGGR